jgi:hypothetical protein
MMERAGRKNSNNKDFQLWQQDNYPILLKNAEMAHQKLDYTHYNPVEAGIVEKATGRAQNANCASPRRPALSTLRQIGNLEVSKIRKIICITVQEILLWIERMIDVILR